MPMDSSKTVVLEVVNLTYHSPKDEEAFFEWVQKIKSVTNVGGHGNTDTISVDLEIVDQDDVRELLALFHRYGVDKKQLIALVKPEYHAWLNDKKKYWYSDIF